MVTLKSPTNYTRTQLKALCCIWFRFWYRRLPKRLKEMHVNKWVIFVEILDVNYVYLIYMMCHTDLIYLYIEFVSSQRLSSPVKMFIYSWNLYPLKDCHPLWKCLFIYWICILSKTVIPCENLFGSYFSFPFFVLLWLSYLHICLHINIFYPNFLAPVDIRIPKFN